MTIDISDNNPRASYTVAQGVVQTTFTVPFEFFEDADVSVYLDDVLKTQGSHYTLSASTVTMSVTGATGGSSVVLVRSVALERTTDFVAGQDINRASLNQQLDTIVAQVSDLKDKADRTVHLSDSEVAPSMLLTSDRKGKVLAFNATTGAVEAGPTSNDIATIATNITEILDVNNEAAAAAASATAAASSATASAASAVDSTNNGAAQVVLSAAQVALANTAKTAAETAETNAETAAALATTNGAAQVVLATDQVALATTQVGLATTQAGLATTNGAAQVTLATTQAGLATTNGAAQVTLATTQANNAAGSATTATAQAVIATTKAGEASASATQAAADVASIAGAASSAVDAANSAAAAAAALDNFDDRYLGPKSSEPTVDNDGNALISGSLYFSTTSNAMQVYDGANWIAASASGVASMNLYEYTATAGQTTFTGSDDNGNSISYIQGNEIVVLNGIILDPSDYTSTSGTSIVLDVGAAVSDLLNVYAFKSFTVADTVSASTGGTFGGNVTVTGTLAATTLTGNGSAITGLPAGYTNTDVATYLAGVGNVAVGGTVDGVDIAARDAILTSTTTTANAAMPKSGGTFTGAIDVTGTVTADALTVDGNATLQNILNIGGADPQIRADTSDGSDNKTLWMGGGGVAYSWDRGGYFYAQGNEAGGHVGIAAGNISGASIKFTTAASEAMRITAAGNLLVGTTDTALYSRSAGSGLCYRNGATLDVLTTDDSCSILNRAGTDGSIIDLRKDGTTVASVGVLNSNNLTISGTVADHGGLQFGTHCVIPMEANADSNGTIDVGSADSRFKDGHFSGTVNANSFSGDGSGLTGVGASTAYGAVGTYIIGYRYSTGITNGSTYAGSSIEPGGFGHEYALSSDDALTGSFTKFTKGSVTLSGTWRAMGRHNGDSTLAYSRYTLYVRIS